MKKLFIKIFLPFLFISVGFCSQAQSLPCGNSRINRAAFDTALKYEREHFSNHSINGTQTVNYLIKVYFHVFQLDDGTNAAATAAQIDAEFSTLFSSYSADAICFLNMGLEFHNNSSLDTNFNADNDPTGAAFASYQVLNCINIFYLKKIKGNNTACNPPCGYGGITLGIPNTFCLVASGNVNDGNSVSHEVGHCMGLLHTFETANGYEKINGSNSSTTADLITDTPADPFAYNGQTCYSSNGCTYTGNCTDPNNQTNFSPPYNNMMAYWYNRSGICVAHPVATNGQFVRANSFLNSYGPLISCCSPANVTISSLNASSGYVMLSAINTFTINGSAIISGTAKATFGGNTILLEPGSVPLVPGFHATPGSGGLVRIIVRPCN
jgi:hypothetical protein